VTPAELLDFLQEFYRETLDLFRARLANARSVTGYDANNGYQQVLGRQEVHLQWLADAIADLSGTAPNTQDEDVPARPARESVGSIIEADIRRQKELIDRWSARVPSVTNARNRKMLELILGEMKEHLRVLEQAKDGRSDILGRHSDGKVLRGEVLPGRPRN
jgi:bacterioferritin (cytochrome b1)